MPNLLAFLERILGPLVPFVQKALGYSITGLTTEKVVFLCHGPTNSSGKALERARSRENRDPDAERFTSTAGYLFSPEDGARAVAEIVVAGLLDPTRMQRLHVLSEQDANALSPATIISKLVIAGFTGQSGADREIWLELCRLSSPKG